MEGVGVAKIAQIMDLCNFLPDMELKGHRIMISDVTDRRYSSVVILNTLNSRGFRSSVR